MNILITLQLRVTILTDEIGEELVRRRSNYLHVIQALIAKQLLRFFQAFRLAYIHPFITLVPMTQNLMGAGQFQECIYQRKATLQTGGFKERWIENTDAAKCERFGRLISKGYPFFSTLVMAPAS